MIIVLSTEDCAAPLVRSAMLRAGRSAAAREKARGAGAQEAVSATITSRTVTSAAEPRKDLGPFEGQQGSSNRPLGARHQGSTVNAPPLSRPKPFGLHQLITHFACGVEGETACPSK